MKIQLVFSFFFLAMVQVVSAQTSFIKTNEQFRNGEFVYDVSYNETIVGEFWPIRGINLVTRETDSLLFEEKDMAKTHKKLGGVATAPDGMTSASVGGYQMEGRALANGVPCGNGEVKDYGIVVVDKVGKEVNITFIHKKEIDDFDAFYEAKKQQSSTLFFLPSIFRNGNRLNSDNKIDKVLVRRTTPGGVQIGVIIFDSPVTCTEAVDIVSGLNRKGASETTHIYVLDGGPSWGQSVKEVNGSAVLVGTRDPEVVTNYLAFY